MPPQLDAEIVIGAIAAFLVAFVVAAFDCHNNVRATLRGATIPVYRIPVSYLVWVLCGAAAIGAFIFSIATGPENWVSQALSLGTTHNIARGFAVGAAVLVLIRSKVLTAGGSDIGGEYFYNLGRAAILQSVSRRRARDRANFLRDDTIGRMMSIAEFEMQLIEFVNGYMEAETESVRKMLADQFRQVQTSKPVGDPVRTDAAWQRYYRSLAGVAVDYCGVAEISRWLTGRESHPAP
jgi:hypothetical protein